MYQSNGFANLFKQSVFQTLIRYVFMCLSLINKQRLFLLTQLAIHRAGMLTFCDIQLNIVNIFSVMIFNVILTIFFANCNMKKYVYCSNCQFQCTFLKSVTANFRPVICKLGLLSVTIWQIVKG